MDRRHDDSRHHMPYLGHHQDPGPGMPARVLSTHALALPTLVLRCTSSLGPSRCAYARRLCSTVPAWDAGWDGTFHVDGPFMVVWQVPSVVFGVSVDRECGSSLCVWSLTVGCDDRRGYRKKSETPPRCAYSSIVLERVRWNLLFAGASASR